MPIREGKAKLWFNTKEEQDQYDDKMISTIRIQTLDQADENYTPIFMRKRQELFLQLNDKARADLNKLQHKSLGDYIDKYHSGKRDHTFWREWTIQKLGLGYTLSYLALRELPIRNFYARAWVMFYFFGKVAEVSLKGAFVVPDEYNSKAVKNYAAYKRHYNKTPPTLDGKLPEEALWKMNQPGYLRYTPEYFISSAFTSLVFHSPKIIVEWDGSFNMPLEGLASPKHKDAAFIDFIYQ